MAYEQSQSNQAMALAGVFQAATLVDQLAKTGQIESSDLENSMMSVLNIDPSSIEDVFQSTDNLQIGLKSLKEALARNGRGVSPSVLQYAMALIAAQAKLSKRPDLMDELSQSLNRAVDQYHYFNSYLHESIISAAARTYQNSVSQLKFRIRVTGNPTYLQNPKTAEQVRAILLFGIRSSLLWRQSGGRRWHFLTHRNKLQLAAKKLLGIA